MATDGLPGAESGGAHFVATTVTTVGVGDGVSDHDREIGFVDRAVDIDNVAAGGAAKADDAVGVFSVVHKQPVGIEASDEPLAEHFD